MRKFDEQETKILRQLIKNPRASDNAIGKASKVPVMTVNRKRKQLEKEGVLNYYAEVSHGNTKTKYFNAVQMYTIKLKTGVTREDYLNAIKNDTKFKYHNSKYHAESYLGEKDGQLTIVIILEADDQSRLTEIFNGDIIKGIKSRYGEDCIEDTETVRLDLPIRLHHNYLPLINMEGGFIKKDWDDECIYVGEKE